MRDQPPPIPSAWWCWPGWRTNSSPAWTTPEGEVNKILQRHHADYASLRRYLVDAGLMQRESGIYRRSAITPPAPETPSGAVGEGASYGADSGMGQHGE
jgi:hypothetical protein